MQLSTINLSITRAYGGVAAFSPSSLFASGEQGAWYDPSDLSTMFQDSAGTTPVTADGQPVGLILDKSGNGNHAFQATAASRPLLQNDGVNNYLAFDGVDDSLSTATNPISSATSASEWHGASVTSFTVNTGLINELGSSSSTTHEPYSDSNFYSSFVNDTRPLCGAIGVSAGEKYVMFEKQSATTHSWRMNGTDKADSSCAFSLSTWPLSIGKDSRGSGWHGNMFSIIILGRLATTQEITDTETWVNGKTGAY